MQGTASQRPTIKLQTVRALHLHLKPPPPKIKATLEHGLFLLTVGLFFIH